MRVAVLGAYGAVGQHLARESQLLGHTVTATGRDAERLEAVPADSHELIAADDLDAVRRLAERQDAVVNAAGFDDPRIAVAATEGGAAYLDISADSAHLQALARLARPGRAVLAGVGLAPGLTNLLAAEVHDGGPVHIGIIGGIGEAHGAAGRRWIWDSAGGTVDSGGTAERVYGARRRFAVPGLGRRTLWRAAFGEQDQLASDFGVPVATWLGLDPSWASPLLGLVGRWPGAADSVDRLSLPFQRLFSGRDRWTVVAVNQSGVTSWATGRNQSRATAVVAALAIEPLVAAASAVHTTHGVLRLADLAPGLGRRGVDVCRSPAAAPPTRDAGLRRASSWRAPAPGRSGSWCQWPGPAAGC